MVSFAGILMVLLAGGPNDLLDLVHSDSYWKAKQVTVSAEQLIADAIGKAAPAEADPSAPQAASVRRLMAIRTLGEMKQADAVPVLQNLADAKEPFVADYAKSAIAAIGGKAFARPAPPAELCTTDVGLLSSQSNLVAQMTTSGKPIPTGDILANVPMPPGANKQEVLAQMTATLLPVAERIGNVRLGAVTVGLCAAGPNQPGYAMIVARGQYDAKAVAAVLAQQQVPMTAIDGLDVFQPEKSLAFILVSDDRAVMVASDNNTALPLESVVAAIKKNAGTLRDDAEMTKLIASVDTTQAMWAVGKMNDDLRQLIPPLAAFNTATFVGSQHDDVLSFSLKAEGSDAAKIKQAVDDASAHLQQAITECGKAVQTYPAAQSVLDALESIKFDTDAPGKVTATGSIKGPMLLPLTFFAMPAARPVQPSAPAKPGGL